MMIVPGRGVSEVLAVVEAYEKDKGFKSALKTLENERQANVKAGEDAGKRVSAVQAAEKKLSSRQGALTRREKAVEAREQQVVLSATQVAEARSSAEEELARREGDLLALKVDLEAREKGLSAERARLAGLSEKAGADLAQATKVKGEYEKLLAGLKAAIPKV